MVEISYKSKEIWHLFVHLPYLCASPVNETCMADFFKHKLHLVILAILFVFLAGLSLTSDGYYGGADNISHYLISRYAFNHPSLFLYSWGRPLYTIISAPFAQFGLHGVKLLNIMLGMLTAWLGYRTAVILKIRPAFLVIIFVAFTPLYFMMMPTALTEILFSFVLMWSVFLFFRENYIASALVISLLPFARTEGFIILPVFFFALLWVRQYKAILFLATGVIFFSVLGSFYYNDLFWVFTQFPYPVTYHHPIYNKAGSLWHFFESRHSTLGLPLEILFLAGITGMVRDCFSRDKTIRHRMHLLFFLVVTPFLLYLVFHSLLFWKAMGGSMGLERVLAAVTPLAALIALKGYDALEEVIGQNRHARNIFLAAVIGIVLIIPFIHNVIPFPLSPEEKIIKESARWIKSSRYAGRVVYFTDNNVPFYLGLDPWQKNPASCYLFGDAKYLDTIPAGSLLVWDAHFGANESKVPLDSLLLNPRHQLIGYFRPDKPWITFGGKEYDCYITTTLPAGLEADNLTIRDSLLEITGAKNCIDTLLVKSFEQPGDGADPSLISREVVHRGNFAYLMDGRTEFSPGLCTYTKDLKIPTDSSLPPTVELGIRAVVYVYLTEKSDANTLLVISFENKNKPYSYTSLNLNEQNLRLGRWNRVSLAAPLPLFKSPDDLLKVYVWNPGKQLFYMDDLRVERVSVFYK